MSTTVATVLLSIIFVTAFSFLLAWRIAKAIGEANDELQPNNDEDDYP